MLWFFPFSFLTASTVCWIMWQKSYWQNWSQYWSKTNIHARISIIKSFIDPPTAVEIAVIAVVWGLTPDMKPEYCYTTQRCVNPDSCMCWTVICGTLSVFGFLFYSPTIVLIRDSFWLLLHLSVNVQQSHWKLPTGHPAWLAGYYTTWSFQKIRFFCCCFFYGPEMN